MNAGPQAILAQARQRLAVGPVYPREARWIEDLARGWCPLYLLPAGAWFRREDHRGFGWPNDVRLCRVLEPWGGRCFPDDILLVDSWNEDGTLRRVGETWFAFSGSRQVISAPAWWPA